MAILVRTDNWGMEKRQYLEPQDAKEGMVWYDLTTSNYKIYRSSQWVTIAHVPGTGNNYGYSMGGSKDYSSGVYNSDITRILFPFDSGTTSFVGILTGTKGYATTSGFNDNIYGYYPGGMIPTYYAMDDVDRITFPFDNGIATNVGYLSTPIYDVGSCNSSSHGFVIGGKLIATTYRISTVQRISLPFLAGTMSVVGSVYTPLSDIGSANSSLHGFVFGGYGVLGGSFISAISRMTFPFNSGTMSAVGALNTTKNNTVGCNSSIHGYIMGGFGLSTTYYSTIDRITFPFDSGTSSTVGNLTNSKTDFAGLNSTEYGYAMGGWGGTGDNLLDTVDRIEFPFSSGSAITVGSLKEAIGGPTGVDGTDFVSMFV